MGCGHVFARRRRGHRAGDCGPDLNRYWSIVRSADGVRWETVLQDPCEGINTTAVEAFDGPPVALGDGWLVSHTCFRSWRPVRSELHLLDSDGAAPYLGSSPTPTPPACTSPSPSSSTALWSSRSWTTPAPPPFSSSAPDAAPGSVWSAWLDDLGVPATGRPLAPGNGELAGKGRSSPDGRATSTPSTSGAESHRSHIGVATVEFPALKENPFVLSLTMIDPQTGDELWLWSR